MLNVCYRCGQYRADKVIDPSGPYAICPQCGHKHAFLQLSLLIVSGASGAGKSAVCRALMGTMDEVVLLEGDILWRAEFAEDNYRGFFETWLRVCKNISQSGRPVAVFNAGMGVPGNVEPCVERRYFSTVHYMALVCDDETLTRRLRQRPEWRGSGEQGYIEEHVRFNRWFKENAHTATPKINLLDTTEVCVDETAEQVAAWMREKARGV
jgi:chloramphenicol 3-O-phosphotransferase